jgi:hypothetical protein
MLNYCHRKSHVEEKSINYNIGIHLMAHFNSENLTINLGLSCIWTTTCVTEKRRYIMPLEELAF